MKRFICMKSKNKNLAIVLSSAILLSSVNVSNPEVFANEVSKNSEESSDETQAKEDNEDVATDENTEQIIENDEIDETSEVLETQEESDNESHVSSKKMVKSADGTVFNEDYSTMTTKPSWAGPNDKLVPAGGIISDDLVYNTLDSQVLYTSVQNRTAPSYAIPLEKKLVNAELEANINVYGTDSKINCFYFKYDNGQYVQAMFKTYLKDYTIANTFMTDPAKNGTNFVSIGSTPADSTLITSLKGSKVGNVGFHKINFKIERLEGDQIKITYLINDQPVAGTGSAITTVPAGAKITEFGLSNSSNTLSTIKLRDLKVYDLDAELTLPTESVTNLNAVSDKGNINLSWTPVSTLGNASEYLIEMTNKSTSEKTEFLVTNANTSSYTIDAEKNNLVNGTEYDFKVYSQNPKGKYEIPATKTYTHTLSAPQNFVATPNEGYVNLTFDAVTDATDYTFYADGTPIIENTINTTYNYYTSSKTPITFYVVANNKAGQGTKSIEKTVTPLENSNTPDAPTDVAYEPGNTTLDITWATDSLVTSYNIYIDDVLVANTLPGMPNEDSNYVAQGLENDKTYKISIAGVNENGEGEKTTINAIPKAQTISVTGNGWLETAYVTFEEHNSALYYNVYYKETSQDDSTYKIVDKELIRKDSTTDLMRADILGLKGNTSYTIKVVPVSILGDIEGDAGTTIVTPKSHDRDGYAFDPSSTYGSTNGAYNDDGTLKENATVIYVTEKNINDGVFTIDGVQYTGLGSILTAGAKSPITTPLNIRFVGKIGSVIPNGTSPYETYTTNYPLGLSADRAFVAKGMTNVTIEGVGDDTVLQGVGLLSDGSSNIVIRNLTFDLFYEDAVSLVGPASNTWVNNCTFNIGQDRRSEGGDTGDKGKGDGSSDAKNETSYFTISYNHYVNSGKSQLLGAGTDEGFSLSSYHHNWYDKSGSRHPRVRGGSVHVYNNYFDGVTGYGSAAAHKSSLLIENNYYENTKRPMIISQQGHSLGTYTGTGTVGGSGSNTLSADEGGAIRQSGNYMDAYSLSTFSEEYDTGDSKANPGNVFDATNLSNIKYPNKKETAEQAKETVKSLAGVQKFVDTRVAPSKITGVEAKINADETFTVTWDREPSATSYNVFMSTDGTTYSKIGTTTGANNTLYNTSEKATSAGTYYFKVEGVNAIGTGSQSDPASVSYTAPDPVTNLTLTPNLDTIAINFTAPTTGASYYKIDILNSKSESVLSVETEQTSYVAKDLLTDTYTVKVTACKGSLSSTSVSDTVVVAGDLTPSVSTINPVTKDVDSLESTQSVVVTGKNLTVDNVKLVGNGDSLTPVISNNGTTATFSVTIPANTLLTSKTIVYDVILNNETTTLLTTFTQAGKVDTTPTTSAITPVSKNVDSTSSTQTVVVTGKYLTIENIKLVCNDDSLTPVITNGGNTATFSVTIPENTSTSSKTLVYEVRLAEGSSTLTSTFVQAGKIDTTPSVSTITPVTKDVASTSSTQSVVVTGKNLTVDNVKLVNGSTTLVPVISNNGTTATFSVTIPENSLFTSKTIVYDVKLNDTATTLSTTFNQEAKVDTTPIVSSITPVSKDVLSSSSTQSVVVVGKYLTTSNIKLVGDGKSLTPVISENGTKATFSVSIDKNTLETQRELVYSVRLDNSATDLSTTFTQAGSIAKVSSISPTSKSLSYPGGKTTITVTGENLTRDNVRLENIRPTISNDGNTATFTVTSSRNDTDSDIVSTYNVYLNDTITTLSSTITVSAKPAVIDNNTDSNNSGGSSVTKKPISSNTSTAVDKEINDAKNNGLTVESDGVIVNISSTEANKLSDNIGLNITKVEPSEQLVDKFSEFDNTNTTLFERTLSNIVLTNDGTEVKKVDNYLTLSFDLSNENLTEDQIKNLSAVRVLDDGSLEVYYLGGSYDEETKMFTTQTTKLGKFAVVVANPADLTRIHTKIGSTSFSVDDSGKTTDVAPQIIGGSTFVPVRFISESLGADVSYNNITKYATIEVDGKVITMKADELISGTNYKPTIVNNRLLIPLRAVSDVLGANVIWNENDKSIDIIK